MEGHVLELHRWPVKSMAGETLDALELFEHGVPHDRRWALTWREGQLLTARVSPRLLAWAARLDDDRVRVTDPAGREWAWDEDLRRRLREDLGRAIDLHEDVTLNQDLHDSVLVTFEGSRQAIGDRDLRRFRTNIHVEIDAAPFAESGWEGRTLQIGEATLDLLHPCKRCVIVTRDPDTQVADPGLLKHLHAERGSIFGINARPRGRATIRVGDPVRVLPGQTG